MMKRSLSILLSFILLASHMSFTIGTHFCGGEAIESKIIMGETHLGCGMMDTEDSCADSENANLTRDNFDQTPCCKNEYQTLQALDEFVIEAAHTIFNVEFAVAIVYTTLNFNLFSKSFHQCNTEYVPTPIEKDTQELFQTYLI